MGVWQIDLAGLTSAVTDVSPDHLIERTRSFGVAYTAIPDDDEFSCEPGGGEPPPDNSPSG